MSNQQQEELKRGEEPYVPERVPFILRALNGIPDYCTFDELFGSGKSTPIDSSSKDQKTSFSWDTSHLDERSYYIEEIGHMIPPFHPVEEPDSEKEPHTKGRKSDSEQQDENSEVPFVHFYCPYRLPELLDLQVNAVSNDLLSNIEIYKEMRSILKAKLAVNELQQWEYDDFKRMVMNLVKPGTFNDEEQKISWQRFVVTNTLLWMIAIDVRYKFDLAPVYVEKIKVNQLSLIWTAGPHIHHFALYPREKQLRSELEKKMAEEAIA